MIEFVGMVLCLLAAVAEFRPDQTIVARFDAAEFKHTDAQQRDCLFRYRIHEPSGLESAREYPLILWFHGARERGEDNLEQLRWMELIFEALPPEKNQYFILAVQCPSDQTSWYHESQIAADVSAAGPRVEPMAVVVEILDEIVAKMPVDEDRIYVAGVSSGGNACWEIAMRYPDRFAALAPMASAGADLAHLDKIRHIPVWAFYSLRDEVAPDGIQETVGRLLALGGSVHFTLVDNAKHGIKSVLYEHDCWTGAIRHYDVMQWLFAQRRGALFSLPPGIRPWPWWNYAALGLMITAFVGAWRLERRRRNGLDVEAAADDSSPAPNPELLEDCPPTHRASAEAAIEA
jgi:predicted peptidase